MKYYINRSIMNKAVVLTIMLIIICPFVANAHYPPGVTYKVFQLPDDRIPALDGDLTDWDFIPDEYIIDTSHLEETVLGHGKNIPRNDLDVKVIVAWNDSTNRLYFMLWKYDDCHNFDETDVNVSGADDLFEIVVDADHSGGRYHSHEDVDAEHSRRLFGAQAQNYHVFTPPRQGRWAWYWGAARWLEHPPYSGFGCRYDGPHGSSGVLTMELYVTPYDYASHRGPAFSAVHDMEEGDVMGISWSFLDTDVDESGRYDGFYNLSHKTRMDRTADLLPNFVLMPVEPFMKDLPRAGFLAGPPTVDHPKTVAFINTSEGKIDSYIWNFGDGTESGEKNPVHVYKEAGIYSVTLTIKGPGGKNVKFRKDYVRTY